MYLKWLDLEIFWDKDVELETVFDTLLEDFMVFEGMFSLWGWGVAQDLLSISIDVRE